MTRPIRILATALLLLACAGTLQAQQAAPCHDPSPHTVRFIPVQDNVSLEVLDWGGGSGRPVVFLAGLGATAHTFDDFAPKLVPQYHVYGITRRGFGASSSPDSGYSADRLADDVLAVLAALKLDRPVLVGHSIAGKELSDIAARHPERIAGLVYLDAAYDYSFYDPSTSTQLPAPVPAPVPPAATPADRKSVASFRAWQTRIYGQASPEGEICAQREIKPNGEVGDFRSRPAVSQAILADHEKFTRVPLPVLAIFAVPHDLGRFAANDPARAPYEARDAASTETQIDALQTGVPTAQIVRLPHANHAVYMSNPDDALRAIDLFLAALP